MIRLTDADYRRIEDAIDSTLPEDDPLAFAVQSIVAAHVVAALREASQFSTPVNVEFRDLADVRDWLRERADRIEGGDRD